MSKANSWSMEEDNYLKKVYKDKTYKEMSLFLNRTEKAIKIRAHRLGLKKSQYYCNENKFKTIKTQEDAYWLGFLYADGYVCKGKTGSYFGLDLQIGDIEHLKKLNRFMEANSRIVVFDAKSPSSENISQICRIGFYRTNICENLISQGCVPRKSKTIQFPTTIPKELIRHFIRGYFDGDGSFGKYKHSQKQHLTYLKCSITSGCLKFLEAIKLELENENISSSIGKDRSAFKLMVGAKDSSSKFLHYMYKDSLIHLDRKYNNYLKLLN